MLACAGLAACVDLTPPPCLNGRCLRADAAPEDALADTPSADRPPAVPEVSPEDVPADTPADVAVDLWPDAPADSPPADAAQDTTSTLLSGLVGYWKLDESAGTMAADVSGKGNHGTHVNEPSPSTNAAPVSFPNPGSLSFAMPQRQAVSVPDSASLSLTGPMTISVWLLPPVGVSTRQGIIEKWEWDGAEARKGYTLRLNPGAKVVTNLFDDQGRTGRVVEGPALPVGLWSHVSSVFDGASLHLYVNGTFLSNAPATAPTDGTTTLEIGRAFDAAGFSGNIDDVRIYNRALSAAEIAALARGSP